jgi:translation initiation factor IF-2
MCVRTQARPDVIKSALAAQGLELEEHGGDVQVVHTSAHTGLGLPELKEALAIQVGGWGHMGTHLIGT